MKRTKNNSVGIVLIELLMIQIEKVISSDWIFIDKGN